MSTGRVGRATRRALDEDLRRERYRISSAQRAALRASATAVDLALSSGSSEAITRANRGYLDQLRAAGLVAVSLDDHGRVAVSSGGAATEAGDDAFTQLLREFSAAAVGDTADGGAGDDGAGLGEGR